jgi:hypothetical protein
LNFAIIICLQSKFVGLAPNPQPGGPGLPVTQASPVVSYRHRVPFLAVLRSKDSNPAPHGKLLNTRNRYSGLSALNLSIPALQQLRYHLCYWDGNADPWNVSNVTCNVSFTTPSRDWTWNT